jgi:hypothetical protein
VRFVLQAAILLAVLAAVTGIALLLGAPNLGAAFGFGQIGFVVALVAVILRF